MEFIDGPSLRAIHKIAADRGEQLPVAEICKIVSMAAGGLQYAHDLAGSEGSPLGLVHRDISPDNILVHRNGAAKVVDFGIAKAANSSSQTRTGTLKGKVAYMPPEQLRGEQLDRRTDVFALGVVLYELLAGRRPWECPTSDVALIGKMMTEEPQPFAELRPDAPPQLCAIVEKALAKDRAQRYQSCHELQADLELLITQMGQSLTAARISDFVKAYSAAPGAPAAAPERSSAQIQQIEDEMNGTGSAPPLVKGRGKGQERDPRTVALKQPVQAEGKDRGLLYGMTAFLVIAIGGGLGGYWFFLHQVPPIAPMTVERAAIVEQGAPQSEPKPPAPMEPAAPPAEPKPPEPVAVQAEPKPEVKPPAPMEPEVPPAEPKAEEKPPAPQEPKETPKPRPRRVARADPPIVIVKDAPEQPKQIVTAKGELVLLIRPWARVEVDGLEVGITPLNEPLMLAAGEHTVRLINSDLQKDIVRTVHITASEKEVLKAILDE
jgi:serine/threonine-protein kinase